MPQRVQMSRQYPWRSLYPDAVIVTRPSKWGNPFRIVPVHKSGPFDVIHRQLFLGQFTDLSEARLSATERFRIAIQQGWGDVPWPAEIRAELAGKDLACWCDLGACHADVLLDLANEVTS